MEWIIAGIVAVVCAYTISYFAEKAIEEGIYAEVIKENIEHAIKK